MNKLVSMDKPVLSMIVSPHRSLSPAGFAVLLGGVAALNLAGGAVFLYLGAWPVAGFMGLDVALIWLAFRWSYHRANRYEQLVVTDTELQLQRFVENRLLETLSFPRGFVHVDIEHDDDRQLTGRLLLRSKGKACEIGSFLGPQDRRALAGTLQKALVRPKI
ncbi:MAG TPA: DUF2244 domain-containing protein [Aestuariivirgaceae bacterium]|jgi:uncharacterized membrane protein